LKVSHIEMLSKHARFLVMSQLEPGSEMWVVGGFAVGSAASGL